MHIYLFPLCARIFLTSFFPKFFFSSCSSGNQSQQRSVKLVIYSVGYKPAQISSSQTSLWGGRVRLKCCLDFCDEVFTELNKEKEKKNLERKKKIKGTQRIKSEQDI